MVALPNAYVHLHTTRAHRLPIRGFVSPSASHASQPPSLSFLLQP